MTVTSAIQKIRTVFIARNGIGLTANFAEERESKQSRYRGEPLECGGRARHERRHRFRMDGRRRRGRCVSDACPPARGQSESGVAAGSRNSPALPPHSKAARDLHWRIKSTTFARRNTLMDFGQ